MFGEGGGGRLGRANGANRRQRVKEGTGEGGGSVGEDEGAATSCAGVAQDGI